MIKKSIDNIKATDTQKNDIYKRICADYEKSEKTVIVLNVMYSGKYLNDNMGHEIINLFKADNEIEKVFMEYLFKDRVEVTSKELTKSLYRITKMIRDIQDNDKNEKSLFVNNIINYSVILTILFFLVGVILILFPDMKILTISYAISVLMIILGIDPGLAIVGFGVVEKVGGKTRMIDYGVITTPKEDRLPVRLKKIYDSLTEKEQEIVRRARNTPSITSTCTVRSGCIPCWCCPTAL